MRCTRSIAATIRWVRGNGGSPGDGLDPEDMRRELESFFWPWPPWANEQLACVFEYLETVISVFFDDVAAHDVEWGWRKVDWVEPSVAIPHRRFLVS